MSVATAAGTFGVGVVFGLALAAPPGPMNAVIAEESVLRGWLAGFTAGLGAMTADFIFFVLSLAGVVAFLDGAGTVRAVMIGAGGLLMLYFAVGAIRDARADFLSDDRLWVGADGTAVGYPLGVNLQPYNVESFPEIEPQHDTPKEQFRHELHEYIDARVDRYESLPETAISFLNDTLLDDSSRDFTNISDLFPRAEHVEQATVDNVVFLQAAPNMDTVTIEGVSTETAMSATSSICNFEWDGRLREYFHAYDSLVEDGSMVAALDTVIEQERTAFRELFDDVATYRAYIPRKRDWGEHNLDTAVAEAVESLDSPRVIEAMD
jgi:hypothetical protein